jgi:hypothetical protein
MYEIIKYPPVQYEFLELVIFGDLHYGSPDQDRKKIKEKIEYVFEKPNRKAAGVGDTLDLSIQGKFGSIGKDESIGEALGKFKEDFYLLIKEGKFLGTCQGNHDKRIARATGSEFDAVESWFWDLGRQEKIRVGYGKPHLVLLFNVMGSHFIVFITHGSGGGGAVGTIANNLLKNINEISNADVYVQGHFHNPITLHSIVRPVINKRTGTMASIYQTYCGVGSFLKKATYAQEARMLDTGTTATSIIMLPRNPAWGGHSRKHVQVSLLP